MRNVEAIEPVEERKRIAGREQGRLPGLPASAMLPGATASTTTTRGRQRLKVHAGDGIGFCTLHIDLQEIDLRQPGFRAQRRQRPHRLAHRRVVGAELARPGGVLTYRRGEAVQLVDDVELGLSLAASGQAD